MGLFTLFTNASSNTTGTAVYPQNTQGRPFMVVQAEYGPGVTGNLIIQGRVSGAFSYVDLWTFTASGSKELSWFPDVRAKTGTLTGGTVSAALVD